MECKSMEHRRRKFRDIPYGQNGTFYHQVPYGMHLDPTKQQPQSCQDQARAPKVLD